MRIVGEGAVGGLIPVEGGVPYEFTSENDGIESLSSSTSTRGRGDDIGLTTVLGGRELVEKFRECL